MSDAHPGFLRRAWGGVLRRVAPSSAAGRESEIRRLRRRADAAARDRRISEVEDCLTQALELARRFGEDDPRCLTAVDEMADFFDNTGDYTLAEEFYREGLQMRERIYGSEDFEVAHSLNNLAILYYTKGTFHQAEPIYRRLTALVEKSRGPDHRETAVVLQNYAALLRKLERNEESERLAARARDIIKSKRS